jgi:hypothetical protein
MRRLLGVAALAVLLLLSTTAAAEARCQSHACWQRVHVNRVERSVEKKIARITPYRCSGYRVAVPCYIIDHESAMAGFWTALNRGSSGVPCLRRACGIYQFLGWAVPWPVIVRSHYETLKRMLAHHRMARRLWAQQRAGAACHWCY